MDHSGVGTRICPNGGCQNIEHVDAQDVGQLQRLQLLERTGRQAFTLHSKFVDRGVHDRPPGCQFAPRCDFATEACNVMPSEEHLTETHRVMCHHTKEVFTDA